MPSLFRNFRGMGWNVRSFTLVGCAVVALIGGWGALRGGSATERPMPSLRATQVAANGLVEGASRERPLTAEIAGTLRRVHVLVNQDVPANTLLFELVNDTQQAQVALAEADLAAAQAQLDQLDADHQRSERMLRTSATSRQEYDQVLSRAKTARANKQSAEARLQLAQAELAKTQVRAPVAGRVLQIHKDPGVQVGPGSRGSTSDPVLRLADLSQRRVRAYVEELDVGRVQVGQAATATADAFPGRQFPGRVIEIAGRMGKDAPESDAPGEFKDIYFREVIIQLEAANDLPINLRVQVRFTEAKAASPK